MQIKIIHYTSPSCSVCSIQDKILDDLQKSHDIFYQSRSITTDFADALKFGVKSDPTLVYLMNDKAVAIRPGLQTKERIITEFKRLCAE